LVNLVSNAIKFTNEGTVKLKVVLKEEKGNMFKLRFDVSDSGVGIPAEKINLIFERFEQLDYSFTRQQGGTGLGLAITKKLVEAMGGIIHVESEVNKGSKFSFEIEFEKINDKTTGQENFIPSFEIENTSLQKMRVLVAEDNKMNQLLVKSILEKYEVYTEITENGEEAIERVFNNKYDLVLMDVQMPKMDGITATKRIRERAGTEIPIIAMTAHVLAGEREKCIEAGMDDYITKPLDEDELVIILKRFDAIKKKEVVKKVNDFSAVPWLNNSLLNSICNNDEKKIKIILLELQKELPGEINALKDHILNKDKISLRRFCHHLKSTLSPLAAGSDPVIALDHLYKLLAENEDEGRYIMAGNKLAEALKIVSEQLRVVLTI
jgi:CheY-like chemotaxis protein